MKNQSEWAIEISGLVKEYGSIRAVDNISFKIPFGVIFAFQGPNGAGKKNYRRDARVPKKTISGNCRPCGTQDAATCRAETIYKRCWIGPNPCSPNADLVRPVYVLDLLFRSLSPIEATEL
jgi:ABC-type transporter Mla maintaining outer membrane lipid asymmetry ATPase subunit MlaF